MKQRLVLAAVVLVIVSAGALLWWPGHPGTADRIAPIPPTLQPAGPASPVVGQAPSPAAPIPLLPASEVTAQLAAACEKIDAACSSVPLWSPDDFDPAPRVRLSRNPGGAVIRGTPGEGKSAWARCVDRTLAGSVVNDLRLPAEEVEIACPRTAHPRGGSLWHDREPFEEVVRRCLQEGEADVDASLDLVVLGDVVEVQNVEVISPRLDDWTRRCIEQELLAARVPFTPENRPGFDRHSLKFKADKVAAAEPGAAFSLAPGGKSQPRNPTDEELALVQQSATAFPANPYAFSRLGALWARRHLSTRDPGALVEARRAYERFLALAPPDDPLVPILKQELDASR